MSVRLGQFIELNGVLPTTQFAYRKGLGTCDAGRQCIGEGEKCIGEGAGGQDRAN